MMDIRRIEAKPDGEERDAIDALLGPPRSAWDGGERGATRDAHVSSVGGRESRAERHLLLPALQALQSRVGWVSEGGLGYVCDRLNVPPADAWGVATFYALLATSPRPPRVVHVCDDIACKCRGADAVVAELERTLGPALEHSGHSEASAPSAPRASSLASRSSHDAPRSSPLAPRAFAWLRSPCLGMCDQAPAAYITVAGEHLHEAQLGHVTAATLRDVLSADV